MHWWALSVCPVPDPKLRTEMHSKLKISRREAHDTDDLRPHLEVKMSKVKITRPLNVVTENRQYFETRRPTNFKLGKRMKHDETHAR